MYKKLTIAYYNNEDKIPKILIFIYFLTLKWETYSLSGSARTYSFSFHLHFTCFFLIFFLYFSDFHLVRFLFLPIFAWLSLHLVFGFFSVCFFSFPACHFFPDVRHGINVFSETISSIPTSPDNSLQNRETISKFSCYAHLKNHKNSNHPNAQSPDNLRKNAVFCQ
jgi:hypothetical protein